MSKLVEEGRVPEEQIVDGSELSIPCKIYEVIQYQFLNLLTIWICRDDATCYTVNLMLKYFDISTPLQRVATTPSCQSFLKDEEE